MWYIFYINWLCPSLAFAILNRKKSYSSYFESNERKSRNKKRKVGEGGRDIANKYTCAYVCMYVYKERLHINKITEKGDIKTKNKKKQQN